MKSIALSAVLLGLASALFFTFTYVLNRGMAVDGGHWAWTASLRYLLTLPMLLLVLPKMGGWGGLGHELARYSGVWLLWSGVGFGLFCVCLTWAASSGPSWLVAGTFQITVIAGLLMSPFIYRDARRRVPRTALAIGVLVVLGVLTMQYGHFGGELDRHAWLALLSVVVAAFAYPLGNRMILLHLEKTGTPLNATQRVVGMTLMSQPLWLLLAAWAWTVAGPPPLRQVLMAGAVALSAGVIATVLFFKATAMVRQNPTALAAVEAMQAAEILFSTAIGALLLGEHWPSGVAIWGVLLVIAGILAFSWMSARSSVGDDAAIKVLRTDRGA